MTNKLFNTDGATADDDERFDMVLESQQHYTEEQWTKILLPANHECHDRFKSGACYKKCCPDCVDNFITYLAERRGDRMVSIKLE
jgi:hypothetical protein